jgi:hypothetical protein
MQKESKLARNTERCAMSIAAAFSLRSKNWNWAFQITCLSVCHPLITSVYTCYILMLFMFQADV